MNAPLLIVSDVDGTLLDEQRRWPAPPVELRRALGQLSRARGAPVQLALASSRTLRELVVLQRALGISGPCIAEDGAIIAVDSTSASSAAPTSAHTSESQEIRAGRRTLSIREIGPSASALRAPWHHNAMFARADTAHRTRQDLQALGFRTRGAIRRALAHRTHSVLIDPTAITMPELARLRDDAAAHGLQLKRGGRWFTLSGAEGKGAALRALRHILATRGVSPHLVAIGDEENDESLLREADRRFVIRNPRHGPHPRLAALPAAIVLDRPGNGGWMEMLDRLGTRS